MRRLATLTALLLVGTSAAAYAQGAPGTVFVSAAVIAATEKVSSSEATIFPAQVDASGTAPGGTLGVGIHLTNHVTARVEASLTDRLTTESDYRDILAGSALGGLTMFAPSLPGVRVVDQTFRTERDSVAVFTLLGYHLRARRASLELLGGLGFLRQTITSSYDVRFAVPAGTFLPPSSRTEITTRSHHAVAVVGADLAVSMTAHAALVPHVRAFVVNNTLNIRPGLSLRWTF